MEEIIKTLRNKAKAGPKKRMVFPENRDKRIIEAAKYIVKEGIAEVLLLNLDNLELKKKEEFGNLFFELRKAKGMSLKEASQFMDDPLYYAAMLTRLGYADGLVAGAKYTTSSVIKAVLYCLGVDRKIGIVSSCFIMIVPDCFYGQKGILVFADCSVIPQPTSEQLANIAISSARFAKDILNFTPRVAFLSFSTKGSAKNEAVQKVKEAVEIAKSKSSEFLIDGELQADSALIPEVAKIKLGESEVAGKANVLIFPNLDSGNIAYKLVQRLAKARAVGPIILGTVWPCSDLSRGCSVDDIIDCTAITVIRAQE